MKIRAEDGITFDAYVSVQTAEPKPGLIICSEAFGVNSHMRAVADRSRAAATSSLCRIFYGDSSQAWRSLTTRQG